LRGGQLQPLSHKLPGVRRTGLQRETGFVEIPSVSPEASAFSVSRPE
jgi:hypothetical protein